ncbi:MAG: hypothetical protein K9K79_06765 [Desulfohalobiaceae bacterium]|nr:hypothetical protein [Desulfohalobiaceae bacterium]
MEQQWVIVLGADQDTSDWLDVVLPETGSRRWPVNTAEECLQALSGTKGLPAVVADLDVVTLNDHFFERMFQRDSGCSAIVLSSRTYHPELKEAMRRNIFAALRKPCSSRELRICLQALLEKEKNG